SHRDIHPRPLVTFPAGTRSVICGFRERGYFTAGVAAMDWFKDAPVLREGFEFFRHTRTGARQQNEILWEAIERRAGGRPLFAFINSGETHSPYYHEGMDDGA